MRKPALFRSEQKGTDQTAHSGSLISTFVVHGLDSIIMQIFTVITLSFQTDRSRQPVQTQIRLLLEEQSDQGLHCLLFHLHLFPKVSHLCLNFRLITAKFLESENLGILRYIHNIKPLAGSVVQTGLV